VIKAALRKALPLFLAITTSGWMLAATQASGQDGPACELVAGVGASQLERCGDRLRSFSLSLRDIRRSVGRDLHARFKFECPTEQMCENEPEVIGWFIDPWRWRNSAQNEPALFHFLQTGTPAAPARRPDVTCGTFDVKIGDMAGRAVCHRFPEAPQSAIIMVASDENTGFVLVFADHTLNWESVRQKTLQMLPRFDIHRATGDAALLRWMK
jgi:hypothetical protein